jgi:hypothetical protein
MSELSLSFKLWLASDSDYDFQPGWNTISATSLQRPVRELVLVRQHETEEAESQLNFERVIPSALGHLIHKGILQEPWQKDWKGAFRRLGFSDKFINRIILNPKPEDLTEDSVPVYVERRAEKELGNWVISGQADLIIDGQLYDLKTTNKISIFQAGLNTNNYILQGSIYRWIMSDIIKEDSVQIDYLFLDWDALRAHREADYPKSKALSKKYPLMSLYETEQYIRRKINLLDKYLESPQGELPRCTSEETWAEPTTYAYYGNANNTRASKVFDSLPEAYSYLSQQKNKGIVRERPGKAKRCVRFCSAYSVCQQAEQMNLQGLLA